MNVKPISEFLINTKISIPLENTCYFLQLDKNAILDKDIEEILKTETEFEKRKTALAKLYLEKISQSEIFLNIVSCISEDKETIGQIVITHMQEKLNEFKYLQLLCKFVLKKNQITSQELDDLLK